MNHRIFERIWRSWCCPEHVCLSVVFTSSALRRGCIEASGLLLLLLLQGRSLENIGVCVFGEAVSARCLPLGWHGCCVCISHTLVVLLSLGGVSGHELHAGLVASNTTMHENNNYYYNVTFVHVTLVHFDLRSVETTR